MKTIIQFFKDFGLTILLFAVLAFLAYLTYQL